MNPVKSKNLIEAALLIKNNCANHGASCKGCIFSFKGSVPTCLISEYEAPFEWQLDKIETNNGGRE